MSNPRGNIEKILVIKLGALGDFIIALGAMRAIRNYHPDAHITLLTTKPFTSLAKKSNYFDKIEIDQKPKIHQVIKWVGLYQQLNFENYDRVYDLQMNDRTNIYYNLMRPKPEWVGTVKGASHYYDSPERTAGLAFDGLKMVLENAGLTNITLDSMGWITNDISAYPLQDRYALIVPGAAPTRPEKIWPKEKYGFLCEKIAERNIQPVIIGGPAEEKIASYIAAQCSSALNLVGKTQLLDIIPLARNALFSVGNDTGPMHMIAPTGCPSIAVFSPFTDPKRNAPTGENVTVIQKDNFDDVTPDIVWQKIKPLL